MLSLNINDKMSSKRRVLKTFAFEKPDRVPVNYFSNPDIDTRLKRYFSLDQRDHEGLLKKLGVDFRGISPAYSGPRLHEPVTKRQVNPEWGWHTRWVEHGSGGYEDYCDFPLMEADEEIIASYPMPDPDDYDYEGLADLCKRHEQYALFAGGAGLGCIINTAGFFRGMEQVFVDLATDDPAGLLLIDRFLDIHYERTVRVLEKTKGLLDFIWMGEDLGTQRGPLISRALFKKHILPRHKRFFELAKAYDLPVMMHTCGSSSWAYDDYLNIGLRAVDTLQPEAFEMSPDFLKEKYGNKLVFHGCISTAGPLAYGSPADVTANVFETLEIMMPGSGYCLSPTHSLQDNTPTENVIALYEAAHQHGRY